MVKRLVPMSKMLETINFLSCSRSANLNLKRKQTVKHSTAAKTLFRVNKCHGLKCPRKPNLTMIGSMDAASSAPITQIVPDRRESGRVVLTIQLSYNLSLAQTLQTDPVKGSTVSEEINTAHDGGHIYNRINGRRSEIR